MIYPLNNGISIQSKQEKIKFCCKMNHCVTILPNHLRLHSRLNFSADNFVFTSGSTHSHYSGIKLLASYIRCQKCLSVAMTTFSFVIRFNDSHLFYRHFRRSIYPFVLGFGFDFGFASFMPAFISQICKKLEIRAYTKYRYMTCVFAPNLCV